MEGFGVCQDSHLCMRLCISDGCLGYLVFTQSYIYHIGMPSGEESVLYDNRCTIRDKKEKRCAWLCQVSWLRGYLKVYSMSFNMLGSWHTYILHNMPQ